MALIIYPDGSSYVFSKKKERRIEMKDYKVRIKQDVTASLNIKADNKAEAKEVVEELIESSKIQHLIDVDVEGLECDEWSVKSVEDY